MATFSLYEPVIGFGYEQRKALRSRKGVKPQITPMPANQGPEYICAICG